jgi:hypothetical protein
MEVKSKFEEVRVYLINALRKIGAVSVIIMALGSGFVIGYYYNTVFCKIAETNQFKHVNTLSETSIAVNEKNQMIIMNKNNGTYKIFEDSIGVVIFNMYANKLFIKETAPTK